MKQQLADLLADHFDSKQSKESVDLPLTWHPSPSLTFTFRSSESRRLWSGLGSYGGSDPFGMFPHFRKRTGDVMAPGLCIVVQRFVRLGIISRLSGDRPMSLQFRKVHGPALLPITDRFPSVLSKVFVRQVSVRPRQFIKLCGVLPTIQFAYQKDLGTWDALLCVSHRVGRKLGSHRLLSVQPLRRSNIKGFSISSALWVLEILCCLYWHSFYQTVHISLWWMVVRVNWLTLC